MTIWLYRFIHECLQLIMHTVSDNSRNEVENNCNYQDIFSDCDLVQNFKINKTSAHSLTNMLKLYEVGGIQGLGPL